MRNKYEVKPEINNFDIASDNYDQSTHGTSHCIQGCVFAVELFNHYFLKGLHQPQISSVSSSSTSSSQSDNKKQQHKLLSERGYTISEKKVEEIINSYISTIEDDGLKKWLIEKTDKNKKLDKNFDNVTVYDEKSNSEIVWWLPLRSIFAVVLSAIGDTNKQCWGTELNSGVEKQKRIESFTRINANVFKNDPSICNTGLRNNWLFALNGYQSREIISNDKEFVCKIIREYCINYFNRKGFYLASDKNPSSKEQCDLFNKNFENIFLPWIKKGEVPKGIMQDFMSKENGLKKFVEKEVLRNGISLNKKLNKIIQQYTCKEAIEVISCDFNPVLCQISEWHKRHAAFLFMDLIPDTPYRVFIDKAMKWVSAKFEYEYEASLKGRDSIQDDFSYIVQVSEALKNIETYKLWLNSYPGVTYLMNLCNKKITEVLDEKKNTITVVKKVNKKIVQLKTAAHSDFITNFFANWFAVNSDEDRIKLMKSLAMIYLKENSNNNNSNIKCIYVSDDVIDAYVKNNTDGKFLNVTVYYINRLFLHALCYRESGLTKKFKEHLKDVLKFVNVELSNQNSHYLRSRLKETSYKPLLINYLSSLLGGVDNEISNMDYIFYDLSSVSINLRYIKNMNLNEKSFIKYFENIADYVSRFDEVDLENIFFHFAAEYGYVELMKLIVEPLGDSELSSLLSGFDDDGNYALVNSMKGKHYNCYEYLMDLMQKIPQQDQLEILKKTNCILEKDERSAFIYSASKKDARYFKKMMELTKKFDEENLKQLFSKLNANDESYLSYIDFRESDVNFMKDVLEYTGCVDEKNQYKLFKRAGDFFYHTAYSAPRFLVNTYDIIVKLSRVDKNNELMSHFIREISSFIVSEMKNKYNYEMLLRALNFLNNSEGLDKIKKRLYDDVAKDINSSALFATYRHNPAVCCALFKLYGSSDNQNALMDSLARRVYFDLTLSFNVHDSLLTFKEHCNFLGQMSDTFQKRILSNFDSHKINLLFFVIKETVHIKQEQRLPSILKLMAVFVSQPMEYQKSILKEVPERQSDLTSLSNQIYIDLRYLLTQSDDSFDTYCTIFRQAPVDIQYRVFTTQDHTCTNLLLWAILEINGCSNPELLKHRVVQLLDIVGSMPEYYRNSILSQSDTISRTPYTAALLTNNKKVQVALSKINPEQKRAIREKYQVSYCNKNNFSNKRSQSDILSMTSCSSSSKSNLELNQPFYCNNIFFEENSDRASVKRKRKNTMPNRVSDKQHKSGGFR